MDDEMKVALLFSVDELTNYNLKVLAPQGVVIGSVSDDTTKFYSSTSNETYENADEAVRNNNKFCFYYVKTIKDLKKQYKTSDLNILISNYLNDSYDKVYYYENINSNNFEDHFLKNCSIDEFNKKFKLKFEYSTKSTAAEQEDFYGGYFGSIKKELEGGLLFQNNAKKQVISTLYNNFLYNNSNSHILLSGPSGVGKTKFLKILSSSDVYPSLYVDFNPVVCNSPRDYLNSILIDYYYTKLAMDDVNHPGIIIIDNIDSGNYNYELYDFFEELERLLTANKRFVPYSSESKSGIILDTSKITFIICGKFNRAEKCKEVPIDAFKNKKINTSKIPVTIYPHDLIEKYGFSDKLLDLFDTRVNMNKLNFDKARYIILNSSSSPLRLFCDDLAKQGIKVNLSEENLDKICRLSYSHSGNLKNMDNVIKAIFNDIILNSQISSGSIVNLDVDNGHQYKKGSKKS